jgi:hypothetical protein
LRRIKTRSNGSHRRDHHNRRESVAPAHQGWQFPTLVGSTAIIDFAELSWFDLGSPDQKETD